MMKNKKITQQSSDLDPAKIAKKIGFPLDKWPGNCYGVACALIEKGIVEGRPCYGHYTGAIEPGTMFANKPIVRHGWVETVDGNIIDPTRWVFEGVAPYIYQQTAKKTKDYDEGGNRFLLMMMAPPPEPGGKTILENINDESAFMISSLLQRKNIQNHLTMAEAHWLGKLPLPVLEDRAKPLYEFLIANNQSAWIPLDNKITVMGINPAKPRT